MFGIRRLRTSVKHALKPTSRATRYAVFIRALSWQRIAWNPLAVYVGIPLLKRITHRSRNPGKDGHTHRGDCAREKSVFDQILAVFVTHESDNETKTTHT